MHFTANRLTTGVGGTALGCYRKVQSLDPANREAVEGLQRVFGKYAAWARAALEKGDAGKARGHVEKLKGLAPEAPEIAELESGVARLEKQAAEAREKAERGARAARRHLGCELRWLEYQDVFSRGNARESSGVPSGRSRPQRAGRAWKYPPSSSGPFQQEPFRRRGASQGRRRPARAGQA